MNQDDLFDDLFDDLDSHEDDVDYGKPIATKLDSQRSSDLFLQYSRGQITAEAFDAGLESCVVRQGMTAEEIERYFPPHWCHRDMRYNRTKLIRAIVLEERRIEGKQRSAGNIRNFWYTNLMYTLMKTMGDTNVTNILVTFNQVLTGLVRTTDFRYADLNLVSEKSDLCHAIFRDSPYPNIIIASEKASYHEHLKRLADIFKITFISLGGQGSYQVFEDLVTQFIEYGIDIDQEFFIYCISDYDPEGHYIQDAAKEHLQRAGIREVTIRRIYLREDQITPGMVDRLAIPYEWRKPSDRATKASLSKYGNFGFRTGGIYKRGDNWVRFSRNGRGYEVPVLETETQGYDLYRIEVDNFLPEVLLHLLIDAFEKDIDGAEYFKQKARLYLQGESAQGIVSERAMRVAGDKAKDRIREFILVKDDLRRELSQKNDELQAGDESLRISLAKEYEHGDESLVDDIREKESEIAELQSDIEDIVSERGDLWRRMEELDQFFTRIKGQRSADMTGLHDRFLESIEEPIRDYLNSVQEEIYPDVKQRYQDLPDALVSKLDYSDRSADVFIAARNGEESFDPQLGYYKEREILHSFSEVVSERSKFLNSGVFFDIPEPPEEIKVVSEVAEEISEKLLSVERKELGPRDEKLLMGLYKMAENHRLYKLFDLDTPWMDIVLEEIEDE